MKHPANWSIIAGLALLVLSQTGRAQEADDGVQRFRMNPFHSNIGNIVDVAADGTLHVSDLANPRFAFSKQLAGQSDLSEGWYLGFVANEFVTSTTDTRLVRVRVTKVGPERGATLQVAPAAASHIKPSEQIVIFRPPGSSTAELEAAPDYAPVDDGTQASVVGADGVNSSAALARSRNNLKQIALAFHNFHDVYKRFPPAVVYGPDGKPWHSWRVLILPFVDAAPLYDQYRFDEPWDGPNNKRLLSMMPEVYHDPIHGKQDEYHTHYAVATGEGTAFPTKGVTMENAEQNPMENITQGDGVTGMRNITDGTSNTVMAGSVSPERRIPWMKPEDVVVGEDFPKLGEKNGFAAPYQGGGVSAGVFMFADGSVRSITTAVDHATYLNLLHIADGNTVGELGELPSLDQPRSRRDIPAAQYVEILRDDKGVRARLSASFE